MRLSFGFALFALCSCACSGEVRSLGTITSPDRKYVLDLSGDPRTSVSFAITHRVNVNIARQNGRPIGSLTLYSFDGFDDSFESRFAVPVWVHPNIVRWPLRAEQPGGPAVLKIQNHTQGAIECLSVNAGDLFLGFDLPPQSEVAMPTTYLFESELFYISAEGCPGSTTLLSRSSAELPTPKAKGSGIEYAVKLEVVSGRLSAVFTGPQ